MENSLILVFTEYWIFIGKASSGLTGRLAANNGICSEAKEVSPFKETGQFKTTGYLVESFADLLDSVSGVDQ